MKLNLKTNEMKDRSDTVVVSSPHSQSGVGLLRSIPGRILQAQGSPNLLSFRGRHIGSAEVNDYIDSICIAWRRGVRKVWRLPNTTHSFVATAWNQ